MPDPRLDIPDFLRREPSEEVEAPARQIDPFKEECRRARTTARICRELNEKAAKRRRQEARKARRAKAKQQKGDWNG